MRSKLLISVLATAAVSLTIAVGAGAAEPQGSALFVQTADGGSFQHGRLTLRGVGHSLAWFSDRPERESGTVSFPDFRQSLFGGDQPAPNAALDLPGKGLGGVAALRLTKPRFDAGSGTVSYRVQRLKAAGGNLGDYFDRFSGHDLPSSFGPASLFIDGAFGHTCYTTIVNATGYPIETVSSSKWSSDEWHPELPSSFGLGNGGSWSWGSQGGAFRGCSNSAEWRFYNSSVSGTFSFQTTDPWTGRNTLECVSSNPTFRCLKVSSDGGEITWSLGPTPP